jgi:membrane protein
MLDRVTGWISQLLDVIERLMRRRAIGRFVLDVGSEVQKHHVSIVAAGAAFYVFLAILPALATLVLVYGLIYDASDVVAHVELLSRFAPESVTELIAGELNRLASAGSQTLGLGLLGSVLAALWSSTKGVRALIEGLNIVEHTEDGRDLLSRYALSIAFTACGVLLIVLVLSVMITLPLLASRLPAWVSRALPVVRFFVLPVMVLVSISALYRFGSNERHRREWLTPGAFVAALMWLASSWLFHKYVEDVASFNATFGSVSTVVVLMLWLYISCLAILIGAEIDEVIRSRRRNDRDTSNPLGSEM